jgi:hypothetical protein
LWREIEIRNRKQQGKHKKKPERSTKRQNTRDKDN